MNVITQLLVVATVTFVTIAPLFILVAYGLNY